MYPTRDSRMKRLITFSLLSACLAIVAGYVYVSGREPAQTPSDNSLRQVFGPITGSEMAVYLRNLSENQKVSLPNYQLKLARALAIGDRPYVETDRLSRASEFHAYEVIDTPTALKAERQPVAMP